MLGRTFGVGLATASRCGLVGNTSAQRVAILRDVTIFVVVPTVVPHPKKIKEDFAPNLVADGLRNAS